MKYQHVEAGPVNQRRIISIIPEKTKTTEKQLRLSNLFTQYTQYREFAGDLIGAICLFVILFGGMWSLPIIAELLK
jgi:hypothetical protein